MDDEQFAEIWEAANAPAADGSDAASDAATSAAAPDETDAPEETVGQDAEQTDDELAAEPATEETGVEAGAAEDGETATEEIGIDDPRHPYHDLWRRDQERQAQDDHQRQLIANANELARQERVRNTLLGLPDTDPDKLIPTFLGLASEIVTPVRNEANHYMQLAEKGARTSVLFDKAIASLLTPEWVDAIKAEMRRLDQYGDPRLIEQSVSLKHETARQTDATVRSLTEKVALLEKQLAAGGRDPNADVVGGAGATGAHQGPASIDEMTDFDQYWEAFQAGRI